MRALFTRSRPTLIAELRTHALDGDERHAEGTGELRLGGTAVVMKLADEHAKRGDVIHGAVRNGRIHGGRSGCLRLRSILVLFG